MPPHQHSLSTSLFADFPGRHSCLPSGAFAKASERISVRILRGATVLVTADIQFMRSARTCVATTLRKCTTPTVGKSRIFAILRHKSEKGDDTMRKLCYNTFRRIRHHDPLAQLGERLGDNQKVTGSSPVWVTKTTQLDIISGCVLFCLPGLTNDGSVRND